MAAIWAWQRHCALVADGPLLPFNQLNPPTVVESKF